LLSHVNPGGYARWWVDELRAMLPTTVAGWFSGDRALTDVGLDDASLHLVQVEQGRARIVKSVARAEVGTSPVVRELVAGERERVRLVLSQGQVLVRTLTLPAAIEENLVEAIGFEIDRVTPFKADQVHYAARVVARDAQKETIDVLLCVMPRTRLDALLGALWQGALSVVEAGAEPVLTGGTFIDLLPAPMKPARKWGQMTRINLALGAGAAALVLLAVLLPVWQKRERVIALIPMVDKTSAEFATNRKIYDEYAKLAGEYNHIATKKHASQPVMAVIEEITRMSPDTTFTQTLELKNSGKVRELVMMGEAASASKVIESLEQSPLFQNASQRSQTTRGSQPNSERYHVATEVKPRPVPAAVLAELEPPPVAPAGILAVPPAPSAAPLDAKAAPADLKGAGGLPAIVAPVQPAASVLTPPVAPAPVAPASGSAPAASGNPAKPPAAPISGKPAGATPPGTPAPAVPPSKVQP
jgi:general secretion pathway protein L